ncbi:type-F conjugative transfer system pilin assembly protein TrbC [Stenoxybacter acetivorans]|uniref:type-F conjugative transfer system pilin assembly protein TrbC n=1 Tax=Stenoxybacter acetivorans TaxID=422441 RepID=UPI00068DB616|nr:type-F conjugative transfer system pilin assembly protein TrbC [Stenoxybacter acetivorans]
MKRLKKQLRLVGLSIAAATLACSALVWANGFASADMEAAKRRTQDTLQRIQDPSNPYVGDERFRQPEIPALNPIKHRLPESPDYGHDKSVTADPARLAQQYQTVIPQAIDQPTDFMVFVSFSLPEASLLRIARESKKAGAVMVLRGFKNGSLKQTAAASEKLAQLGGEVLIHPELFNQYQIAEVPTFVLAKNNGEGSCADNEAGKCTAALQLKGDVSLHAVLERFSRERNGGELAIDAVYRLSKLEGRQ